MNWLYFYVLGIFDKDMFYFMDHFYISGTETIDDVTTIYKLLGQEEDVGKIKE